MLTAAKIRKVRIHDLRHTRARHLLAATGYVTYVQEQCGHCSLPAVTLDFYSHVIPRNRRHEVNCLDDAAPAGTPVAPSADEAAPAQEAQAPKSATAL